MNIPKGEVRINGPVSAVVVGEGNVVTIIYQSNRQVTVPFLAPPHPSYSLVGRDDSLQEIKRRLFASDTTARCALIGKPGVGKTAIALSLAHDRDVLSQFHDGVLWTGLGRDEQDIMPRLGKWAEALGMPKEQMASLRSVREWAEAVHATIGMKRMLIVIDDAWQAETALAFRVGGPNCAHLVTSRIPRVAWDFAGDATITINELNQSSSLELLARFVPELIRSEPEAMADVMAAAGGLPLSIVLIGKYLRIESNSGQKERLKDAIEQLRRPSGHFQLSDYQDPLAVHPSIPSGEIITVPRIIKITCDALSQETLQAFWALSVFPPKPNTFSFEAASAVIAGPPASIDTLSEYGLLEKIGNDRYTLHQVIEEFARTNLEDKAAFDRMGSFFSALLMPYSMPYSHFERTVLNTIYQEEENIRTSLEWYRELDKWAAFTPLALGYCSYVGYTSRWQEEIEWGIEVGKASEKLGDNLTKAHVYCHVLPWPLWMRGAFEQARDACWVGIQAATELDGIEKPVYLSLAYHNLYRTALQEIQVADERPQVVAGLKEMKTYSEKCLQYAQQAVGTSLFEIVIGLAYSDIGFTALKLGNYSEAELWFRKRLEMARNSNSQVQISARLFDVALALIGQGKFSDARIAIEEGQAISEEWNRGDLNAEFLFCLAKIEREIGDPFLAEKLEERARWIWSDLGFTRDPFTHILNRSEVIDLD